MVLNPFKCLVYKDKTNHTIAIARLCAKEIFGGSLNL